MRHTAACLWLFISTVAVAQTVGEVERIGFDWRYRPDCWTPMLVRIGPDPSLSPGRYQIRVEQQDLDGDRPIYTRNIDIGAGDGQLSWWMYFIPEPTGGGLPDAANNATLRELQSRLRVYLVDERGRGTMLPIRRTVMSVDPVRSQWDTRRGTRFVVYVGEPGRAAPSFRGYEQAAGLSEGVTAVLVQPRELPDSPLGYDGVDAIVWLNAEPFNPNLPSDAAQWRAVRDYVRQGGRLVICQTIDRDSSRFGEMLPVTGVRIETRQSIGPLRALARAQQAHDWSSARLPGPFRVAHAQARPDAVVTEWITWEQDRSPFIVHRAYGLGTVTWVAQDLGDPALTGPANSGWVHVWDRVFEWRQYTQMPEEMTEQERTAAGQRPHFHDLGESLLAGIEHGQRSAALLGLAVLFFVAYWLVAGPGIYLFLVSRNRGHLSWFAFGLSALVATALTLAVVQLVLRGPPRVRHVTVLQQADGQPAVAHSRIGLYIPRDGMQKIGLGETAGGLSAITPPRMHPQHVRGDIDFPARQSYSISVDAILSGEAAQVYVPYRSTLKKLEARWAGENEATISGRVRLAPRAEGYLDGPLTNGTGRDLRYVYLGFRNPQDGRDYLFYISRWPDGVTINPAEMFFRGESRPRLVDSQAGQQTEPTGENNHVYGAIDIHWNDFWYSRMRGGMLGEVVRPDADRHGSFFAMMSFFDALPPARPSGTGVSALSATRLELLRRASRHLDRSRSLAAGQLVIIAQSEGPLPFPFEVADETIAGEGVVYYQFVLPLERGGEAPQEDSEM